MAETTDIGVLRVTCPDGPGIVAAITRFLHERGANITHSDQYSTGPRDGTFFLRMAFHLEGLAARLPELRAAFAEQVGERLAMDFALTDAGVPKKLAIMVSREDHALVDLLWRWRRRELFADIGVVVSNWPDLREQVEPFGVPYEVTPVTPGAKPQAEAAQLELLGGGRYDLVVLARYMQILSGDFLARVGCPVINIHHSFLPAFAGAGPYQRAKERGVKLIGATAHYATTDLDEGPIIEQDVIRVSHRDTAQDMARMGADVERTVLQRAVRWHCEDRILLHGATTVVFR